MSEQSLRSQISSTTFRHEMVEPERGSEGLSGSGERGRLQWRREGNGAQKPSPVTIVQSDSGLWLVGCWSLGPLSDCLWLDSGFRASVRLAPEGTIRLVLQDD